MNDKKTKSKRACLIIILILAGFAIAAFSYLDYGLVMAWYTLSVSVDRDGEFNPGNRNDVGCYTKDERKCSFQPGYRLLEHNFTNSLILSILQIDELLEEKTRYRTYEPSYSGIVPKFDTVVY